MQAKLKARLEELQPEMLRFTEDLIRIPSENPPGRKYAECRAVIRQELDRLGFPYEEVGECILAEWGNGPRLLYFHGHYDVVPASTEDQFLPVRKGVNLFGRGSSDMKSGLAAMLYAVKALKDCGITLAGRISLAFVPDEETAGERGTASLIAAGRIAPDAVGMLTPEPTSGVIWNGCRGALSLEITIQGKPAHVSLEHQGVNAFEHMLLAGQALLELKHELKRQGGILMLGGQCSSGSNFNLVPGECRFTLDRRLNPGEDLDIETARIFERLNATGVSWSARTLQTGRSSSVAVDGALALSLGGSIQNVTARAPVFEHCPGLLETRYYAALGIPAFAYGPGLLSVSHGPHEFVPMGNILSVARVYSECALDLLGKR